MQPNPNWKGEAQAIEQAERRERIMLLPQPLAAQNGP